MKFPKLNRDVLSLWVSLSSKLSLIILFTILFPNESKLSNNERSLLGHSNNLRNPHKIHRIHHNGENNPISNKHFNHTSVEEVPLELNENDEMKNFSLKHDTLRKKRLKKVSFYMSIHSYSHKFPINLI
jgi:hypothetical protein